MEMNVEDIFLTAGNAMLENNLDKAASIFSQFIDQGNDNSFVDDALYNLGLIYFLQKDYNKAITTFNIILTDYPDSTIDSVGEIIEKGHTGAKAYLGIGNCYIAAEEFEKAIEAFKAISKYPESYTEVKEGDNVEKKKEFFYAIGLNKIIDIYENVLNKKDDAEIFKNLLQEKYPGSIFIRS